MGAAARTSPRKTRLTEEQQALVERSMGLAGAAARPFTQRVARDDVEDMRQEAMIGLCHAACRFDPEYDNGRGSKVRFSAYGICGATRSIRNHLKAVGRRKHLVLTRSERFSQIGDVAARAEDLDDDERRLAAIRRAIGRLSQRHADILLSRLAGESLRSIGERLRFSKERIRHFEADALDRVRLILEREGVL